MSSCSGALFAIVLKTRSNIPRNFKQLGAGRRPHTTDLRFLQMPRKAGPIFAQRNRFRPAFPSARWFTLTSLSL